MFCVIYSFQVKKDQETAFEKAWKELTLLIYTYEGSLGSRLHKQGDLHYIAYAQWPDRDTWEKSGNNMPETAEEIRKIMKNSCEKIKTLFELDVAEDLLENAIYAP